MPIPRARIRARLALGAALLSLATPLLAQQAWPNRPIRLVVPYPAGGATDLLARTFGQKLSENLGVPVTLDNRGGANGIVGSEIVAKAPPDGYTMLIDNVTFHSINATLYKKIPFNTQKDFELVSLVGWVDNVLVINPATPAKTVRELADLARARPGQFSYASSGSGSTAHLSGVLFNSLAGVETMHIPYKGGTPAMTDLMGGQVSMYFAGMSTALPFIKSGKLRALGVAGAQRNAALPDVPTMAEAGLPGFDASNWYAVMLPAGTPREIVNRLNAETIKVLQHPEVRERLVAQGYTIKWSTPQEVQAYVKTEMERWAKIVKASGAQAD